MTSCVLNIGQEVTADWTNEPAEWRYDPDENRLMMRAPAGSDLIHEPLHSAKVVNSPYLLFPVEGDFALSADASMFAVDGRWSAAILIIWEDEDHWAKLCLERNHLGIPSIITVVTNGWSDDAVHWTLPGDTSWLRVVRTGESYVMHASEDGIFWKFVRVFRLEGDKSKLKVGFLTQSPFGTGCTAVFNNIRFTDRVPQDARDGT